MCRLARPRHVGAGLHASASACCAAAACSPPSPSRRSRWASGRRRDLLAVRRDRACASCRCRDPDRWSRCRSRPPAAGRTTRCTYPHLRAPADPPTPPSPACSPGPARSPGRRAPRRRADIVVRALRERRLLQDARPAPGARPAALRRRRPAGRAHVGRDQLRLLAAAVRRRPASSAGRSPQRCPFTIVGVEPRGLHRHGCRLVARRHVPLRASSRRTGRRPWNAAFATWI